MTLFHLVADGAPQRQGGFEPGKRLLQVLLLPRDLQRLSGLKLALGLDSLRVVSGDWTTVGQAHRQSLGARVTVGDRELQGHHAVAGGDVRDRQKFLVA